MLPRQLTTSVNIDDLPAIIARSATSEHMLNLAQHIAPTPADVLLEGEQGSGKKLLANWIHRWSTRRTMPALTVDCAASTEAELEKQLFGPHPFEGGSLRLPSISTLMLAEVGELPLRVQAKLMQALEDHDVRRRRAPGCRPRIIATTSVPLRALVAEKKFRADLYYYLNVIPITVPALRVRREDIPLLAEHFLAVYSAGPRAMGNAFLCGLLRHSWPGNISELSNLIRRAATLSSAPVIGPEFLQFDDAIAAPAWAGLSWRDAERRLLQATLAATEGNRTRTAEMLGVSPRTVRNKIKDFGLAPQGQA